MAMIDLVIPVVIFAVIVVVIFIAWLVMTTLNVKTPFLNKTADDEKTKELMSKVKTIPEQDRPIIVNKKYGYKKIAKEIIMIAADIKTKKPITQIRAEDESLTPFRILDDPIFVRLQNPLQSLVNGERKIIEIIEDDPITQMFYDKVATEVKLKSMMNDKIELMGSQKNVQKAEIEYGKNMRNIAYFQSPQSTGTGWRRPWQSSYGSSWRNRLGLGSEGENNEENNGE